MRRKLVVVLAAFTALAVLHPSNAGDGKKKPPYVHSVFFYLKKDAPKDAASTLIADCHELLAKIPSVKGLWAGRPAAKDKSTPKFAIGDYDVGLLVLFDNSDGLKVYLDHDLHKQFLEKHGKYWERVPVYDFINQKK